MKITPDNKTELNAGQKIDSQSGNKPGVAGAGADRLIQDAMQEKNTFASVLDRVTRSHNNGPDKSEPGKSTASAETRERKTSEDDNAADEVKLANVERAVAREPVAIDEVNTSRPVIHSLDLDSIVTAYQVQLIGNGQKEVTLELSRSMLEGLRVKLTADGAGRVSADFLAATEGVKALLDGRSAELIEQLRSRGIDLAEFRSSVAADANSRNDSQEKQSPTPGEHANDEIKVESTNSEDVLATGATYRA